MLAPVGYYFIKSENSDECNVPGCFCSVKIFCER